MVRTALAARRPGEGRWGYVVAMTGVAVAVALLVLWALSLVGAAPGWWPDSFGFVISACWRWAY